jgi:hypothetical protein
MKRALRTFAATVALGAAVLGGSAPVASAGDPATIRTAIGDASFDDLGELLVVTDNRKDGLSTMANLTWDDGSVTIFASGAGDDETRNLSIPEGKRVWLLLCYRDNGVTQHCYPAKPGTA